MKTRISFLLLSLITASAHAQVAQPIAPSFPYSNSSEIQHSCSYPGDPTLVDRNCVAYMQASELNRVAADANRDEMRKAAEEIILQSQIPK